MQARKRPRAVPVYQAIQEHIREVIRAPGFVPGGRVPSERALAEELGANRMTVRKAMEGLVAEGLLERNGTSGTRVRVPHISRPVDARTSLGIARIIQSAGGTPGTRLLHFEPARASARIASRMAVPEGTEIVIIRRLLTVNDTPFCIETSHLPAARVPGLAAEDLTAGQSLYALLRARYDIGAVSGERVISVAACTELEARLLDLPAGAACLLLRLVAADEQGRPVEYLTSVNHPDLVVFKTGRAEADW